MATVNQFYQDEAGQWWFRFSPQRRTRATVLTCAQCEKPFPSLRRAQRFCSVKCRAEASRVTQPRRICPTCHGVFEAPDATQRFCSHRCAAKARHAQAPVTTQAAGSLKNADHPQYYQDDRGQWWYQPVGTKEHGRTRAFIKTCPECGQRFLTSVFHQKRHVYCSKACGGRAHHKANPGKFVREKSSRWKGGTRRSPHGYVMRLAPDHPSIAGTARRYVLEHRLVMEQMLGRFLEPNEHVHHKNGIRDDNRPENLELWVGGHPPGARSVEQQHCPTCTCFAQS